jgi:hypothetical protein
MVGGILSFIDSNYVKISDLKTDDNKYGISSGVKNNDHYKYLYLYILYQISITLQLTLYKVTSITELFP